MLPQRAHGPFLEAEFVFDSLIDLRSQCFIAVTQRVLGGARKYGKLLEVGLHRFDQRLLEETRGS